MYSFDFFRDISEPIDFNSEQTNETLRPISSFPALQEAELHSSDISLMPIVHDDIYTSLDFILSDKTLSKNSGNSMAPFKKEREEKVCERIEVN
jgi:hypothetical protein